METQFKARLLRIGGAVGITIPSRIAELHKIGKSVVVTIDFEPEKNARNQVQK